MKKGIGALLSLLLLLCLLPAPAAAADGSRSYAFHLTVDGAETVETRPGSTLTVSLSLDRTDSEAPAVIYGVQAELWYDDSVFELVPDSAFTYMGVDYTDMARRTGGRAFYLTYVSFSGGEVWPAHVTLGTFRLRVVGEGGVTSIIPENCAVPTQNGADAFNSTSNRVTAVLSTDCAVTFRSAGGTEVPGVTVQYGECVPRPADPAREGYTFMGWYANLDRTVLWDFDKDTAQGNMTLYAGWQEGAATGAAERPAAGGGGGDRSPALWAAIAAAAVLAALIVLLLLLRRRKKNNPPEDPAGPETDEKTERGAAPEAGGRETEEAT